MHKEADLEADLVIPEEGPEAAAVEDLEAPVGDLEALEVEEVGPVEELVVGPVEALVEVLEEALEAAVVELEAGQEAGPRLSLSRTDTLVFSSPEVKKTCW